MKKRYTNPVTEIVELAVLPIMTTTSVIASLGEEDGGVVVMISTNQVLPVAIGVESGTVSRVDKFCPPFLFDSLCVRVVCKAKTNSGFVFVLHSPLAIFVALKMKQLKTKI